MSSSKPVRIQHVSIAAVSPTQSQILTHSPASELKTVRVGWFCTNTTALAVEHVRHGHSCQSAISATEIVTLGRTARQIAREDSILKFSG